MQASLRMRNLLFASWETDRESLENVVPKELELDPDEGRLLVTLAAFRVEGGHVGRLPVPPYTQINVRTPVRWKDEPAAYFIASRVTAGGLPASLLGAPVRFARLRVAHGALSAPGRGISLRYRVTGPAGALQLPNVGLFENDGLRELRVARGETAWQRAELVEPAQADFLVALGFHPPGEPELLYAASSSLAFDVPRRPKSGKDEYD